MERVKGIGPSQPAWKAGALPLSYTRIKLERKTGFEPATLALARRYSTTEPLPHFFWCPEAESNHRHGDFQSPALPTELSGLNITFIVYAKLKFLSNFFKISQRNNSIYIFKFTKSILLANKIFQKKEPCKTNYFS